MRKRQIFDSNDPYSSAIKSLVKKTVIIVGAFVLIAVVGVGYLAVKSGLKTKSTGSVAEESPAVLAETTQASATITPTLMPLPTIQLSPSPSVTSKPTNSPSPSPTSSPTITPTQSPRPTITPSPTASAKTIQASAALDGYAQGTGLFNTNSDIRVGSMSNGSLRGFLSFDVNSINTSDVKNLKLRLYQNGVKGNPFTSGGDIRIDLVNYGSSLDPGDYSTSSLIPSFTTISNNASSGWKEADILDLAKKTKAENRQYLQLRLHFNFESEGAENYVSFESADNALKTNNLPQLLIELK